MCTRLEAPEYPGVSYWFEPAIPSLNARPLTLTPPKIEIPVIRTGISSGTRISIAPKIEMTVSRNSPSDRDAAVKSILVPPNIDTAVCPSRSDWFDRLDDWNMLSEVFRPRETPRSGLPSSTLETTVRLVPQDLQNLVGPFSAPHLGQNIEISIHA